MEVYRGACSPRSRDADNYFRLSSPYPPLAGGNSSSTNKCRKHLLRWRRSRENGSILVSASEIHVKQGSGGLSAPDPLAA